MVIAMKIKRKKTINYIFNQKHIDYIRKCEKAEYNIAEGSIRAGKTVDHIYDFAHSLKTTRDRLHLVTAPTVAQAKLVIGDSNGFGLEHVFRGQSRWGKYKQNEALIIKGPDTKWKERIIIFAGGGKADSFKSMRGNSYGMWLATEINLHHENTIREAFNRTAAALDRKIYWDLNPDNPNHPVYEYHIDKYIELGKKGELNVNYGHFLVQDNPIMTEKKLKTIHAQYTPGTVWHKRDILGLRVVAEGLIYEKFADEPEKYLTDNLSNLMTINVGVDFGGNKSKHTFVATGITHNYEKLIVLITEKHEPDTPDTLNRQFVEFVKRVLKEFGNIDTIFADSAEQVLKKGLQKALFDNNINIKVKDSIKNEIIDRIRLVNSLIATNRFFYTENCETLVDALSTAVWDDKELVKDVRLDDGTSDIDTLDAFEYSFEKYLKALTVL